MWGFLPVFRLPHVLSIFWEGGGRAGKGEVSLVFLFGLCFEDYFVSLAVGYFLDYVF